jgi:hypothetical protein
MRMFFLCCLLIPAAVFSQQRFHITAFGGFANYQGDLQTRPVTLDQSNGAFGVGAKYDLTPHFSLRSGFVFSNLSADDKRNTGLLQARNLNFRSRIAELNLLLEYNLFDLSEKKWSPYAFGGIAVFRFNPFTYDTSGYKVFLQPLSTEGQGLAEYPDREKYRLTQLAIPFGGGIKLRVTDNAVISFEMGLRKLFTDYLDDLSTTYVDPVILAQHKGLKAVEMSYRGGELKDGNQNYPADGEVRGGSKYKDWYYFSGITLAIGINSNRGSGFSGKGNRGRISCPTP